jgi:hypothetical protein
VADHTPGPWLVYQWDKGDDSAFEIADKDGRPTAIPVSSPWRSDAERDANARLIAAAPDLLAVCYRIIETGDEIAVVKAAKAAVAKAEGRDNG